MGMNDDQIKASRDFDEARKRMMSGLTVQQGAIKAETVYAEAYQGLVRAGGAPQIKAKYRFTEVAHQRRAGS
jgi:hypothetical protein